jgi:GDPmannose 4,6-dehydratase
VIKRVKKALITGITGQDGSYQTELLLEKDYEVHGIIRRASNFNTQRIDHLIENPEIYNQKLFLHYGDLTDGSRLVTLIAKLAPDEVYNLAAQSHVRVSEAIRITGVNSKFYQASSSEMFGATPPPQNEETIFYPRSPYGAAKVYSYWMTKNYREAYGIFACNGILFNHESERRGETFVTQKIALGAARIAQGKQKDLVLGNLDAIRDWGYAPEYGEGMWRMLQHIAPDDYVLATNTGYSVGEFLKFAFDAVNLDWEKFVKFDQRYERPTEVDALIGDFFKAERVLGWKPQSFTPQIAEIMVTSELRKLQS